MKQNVGISLNDVIIILKLIMFNIHGEFKLSLGVDGEITETVKFPALETPFEAVDFDG
jgi:hypothetical protein